jgi:hypothetical protein
VSTSREDKKLTESVAAILERELDFTIEEWLKRVNLVPELTKIPLSDAERTGHLHKLFNDCIARLRLPRRPRLPRDTEAPLSLLEHSISAAEHGKVRFAQGYSAPMLVEESRIFQVSTCRTLHIHHRRLNHDEVLLDVMTIADEADGQLADTVCSFMAAKAAS